MQQKEEDRKKEEEEESKSKQQKETEAAAAAAPKATAGAGAEGEAKETDESKKEGDEEEKKSDEEGGKKEEVESKGFKFNFKFDKELFTPEKMKGYVIDSYYFAKDNTQQAYQEMMGENQESRLSKKVHQAQTFRPTKKKEEGDEDEDGDGEEKEKKEEEEKYTGGQAIVLVKEGKSAWESMKERLSDSPLIKEILKNSKKYGQQAAGTDIGKKATEAATQAKEKLEDAREFWETSQNPLVYTISGVWENMTQETEEGIAVSAIRKLDPDFDKEDWAEEVKRDLAPELISAHLAGNTAKLKPWLGEAVFAKLSADIRARKSDGIVFDTNILDIDENQIVLKFLENGGPVVVIVYMVQQINCIRNRKGEIIEGSETEIRAKFYSMAFQQVYDEDEEVVNWKVVDYDFAGDIPYY